MQEKIGRFTILGKLGQGGMGAIYVGNDEALERRAAIKLLLDCEDPTGLQRFLLEARAAASVSHPNICQIYEIGDEAGRPYIAMELLEGEGLHARLSRGALPLGEAVAVTQQILGGLDEIHRRGFVHRDLKPSNVHLAPHGVKILDFGLARSTASNGATAAIPLTKPGAIVGTPQYMAPEQWTGAPVGPATDLFAVGAMLYEMISGRQAFPGETIYEICDAVAHHQPPALSGDAAVVAYDRIIQQAIEKRPADRFPSAKAMAEALRGIQLSMDRGEAVPIRQTTRMIALPFRVLRPDPETDFLAFSLPDALGGSLSKLESVVVRSTLASGATGADPFDMKSFAREMGVDMILTGTILRAGDQIRVTAQLTDGTSGTILWTKVSQGTMGDLFALQDSLLHEITDSLATPLTRRDQSRLLQDVPATPRAYELYLRANQLTLTNVYTSSLMQIRDMYKTCLEDDPRFAPAWARLGRVYRMIAKYGHDDPQANYLLAEEALSRALEINPDLSIAHNYYAHLLIEEGRSLETMTRLIERAQSRVTDPGVFAGLVPALRFCGLLHASLAAERRASRLEPNIRTSVHYTHWMLGEYERAMAADNDEPQFIRAAAPAMLGRVEESIATYREFERRGFEGGEAAHTRMVRAAMEGDSAGCLEGYRKFLESDFRDPEGIFFIARNLARVGAIDEALSCLTRAVDGGFWSIEAAVPDPWLDSLRGSPQFGDLIDRCETGRRRAATEYARVGGERLLGPLR
jgi:serine/threonine protein kinase/tetratricopeptide (TPR) repeat protein